MQGEVCEFLKDNYPKAYTVKELSVQIGINDTSIVLGLNKLVRFNLIMVRPRDVVCDRVVQRVTSKPYTMKYIQKVNEYYYSLDSHPKDLYSSSAIE
jgi:hypothetical protein